MKRQTVCLNMIVRDETPVIRRCLESVRPLIDAWVIVDTGSTDGTQALIRELLADVPGHLYERPWVDFAHNRTEAIQLARGCGDYLLFIDADEALVTEPGFEMPPLTADVYSFEVRYGGCTYLRKQLVRNDGRWRYEGVVHEYVTADGAFSEAILPGLANVPRHDGARARDPLTYRRDALILENALLSDPNNARYVFYLAQSYRDASDPELALRHYQRRVELGGWPDEVWYSLYQIAQLKERLQKPWAEVTEAYLAAYQACPDRAEPLFRIAMHHQAKAEYATAHLFLSRAAALPRPAENRLFVERAMYDYQIAVELAVAAYYVGDHRTAIETNNRLLRDHVPAHAVDQIIRNRRFSLDVLAGAAGRPKQEPGRVRIFVTFRDPGPELDDCVESLMRQEYAGWEAVFIDDGSANDQSSRLPLDDVRVSFGRHSAARGAEECLAEQLRGESDGRTIVVPITAAERLADRTALTHILTAFSDPACEIVYGQFRTAAGAFGTAEPASCEEDFRARGAALACGSPVAFRAALWQGSWAAFWQHANFAATRFLDAPLTARAAVTPPPAPARNITTQTTPLISCLMVTLDRLSLAKRAIRSFGDQTWPNRELVIVTDGTPRFREALERFVAASRIDGVRIIDPGPGRTLGALRNVSLAEAKGEVVCQWDDDDCSHPDRLRVQYEHMVRQNARASFLADHLQMITEQRVLCWIDWTLGGVTGSAALFPGSLMMFSDSRFQYPEDGPNARQGEDSVFLDRLYDTVPVTSLAGAGYLYLYEYHGRNTFSRNHHLHLTNFRKGAADLHHDADRLREAVSYYDVPRPVVVLGREGPVFALG